MKPKTEISHQSIDSTLALSNSHYDAPTTLNNHSLVFVQFLLLFSTVLYPQISAELIANSITLKISESFSTYFAHH